MDITECYKEYPEFILGWQVRNSDWDLPCDNN